MQAAAPLSALGRQVAQWAREMLAEGHLSEGTVHKYAANLYALAALAESRGIKEWSALDRSTVLAYVSDGQAAASTRRNRLLALRAFYRSLNTTAGYLKADDEWCRSEHRNSHPLNKPAEG